MAFIAKETGLSEAQVYKWGWDQKKKLAFRPRAALSLGQLFRSLPVSEPLPNKVLPAAPEFESPELLPPHDLDLQMYQLQKAYRVDMESASHDRHSTHLANLLQSFSRL